MKLFLLVVLLFLGAAYYFLAYPFIVDESSSNLYKKGDLVLSEGLTYLTLQPSTNDRVLFKHPETNKDDIGKIIETDEENPSNFIIEDIYGEKLSVSKKLVLRKVYFPNKLEKSLLDE